MNGDSAKLAGATAIFYVVFFVLGIFLHYVRTGESYILHYSLTHAPTWVAGIGGAIIGIGLWMHYEWAWWFGLAAVAYQLLGVAPELLRFSSEGAWPSIGMLIIFALFLIFLLLLSLPKTRALCKR